MDRILCWSPAILWQTSGVNKCSQPTASLQLPICTCLPYFWRWKQEYLHRVCAGALKRIISWIQTAGAQALEFLFINVPNFSFSSFLFSGWRKGLFSGRSSGLVCPFLKNSFLLVKLHFRKKGSKFLTGCNTRWANTGFYLPLRSIMKFSNETEHQTVKPWSEGAVKTKQICAVETFSNVSETL